MCSLSRRNCFSFNFSSTRKFILLSVSWKSKSLRLRDIFLCILNFSLETLWCLGIENRQQNNEGGTFKSILQAVGIYILARNFLQVASQSFAVSLLRSSIAPLYGIKFELSDQITATILIRNWVFSNLRLFVWHRPVYSPDNEFLFPS